MEEENSLLGKSPKPPHFVRSKKGWMFTLIGVIVVVSIIIGLAVGLTRKKPETPKTTAWFHQQFLENVNADEIRDTMKYYSSIPHIAGSWEDREQALYTKQRFESFGLSATIQEIPVLLSYPVLREVGIVYPLVFNCTLKEAVVNDTTSGNPDAAPTWNGYTPSGEAIGELVYVNYGTFEDYEAISDVNLTGKIVIVRYGQIFRGDKVKFAQERGAVGVLIYIDPADTGYLNGPVYPEGPWSSNSTVQRGSIWDGNGDPGTPGWASYWGGPRITYEQAQQSSNEFGDPLPTIPVQPLGYGDAYPLLSLLQGNPIPNATWAGGFNLTSIGPGPVQVRINIVVNNTVTPIWNVVARIEGNEEPDRIVVMGGHRDAWTMGAGDPISGTSVLEEVARGFGNLTKLGWAPRRTILICSWDAEEYGLIGSIEFIETYFKTLSAQTIAYLNVDIAVTGGDIFSASGSPSMTPLIKNVTNTVITASGKPVSDFWTPQVVYPLGSGSDFTGFIHHAGISSLSIEFDDADGAYSAVYHSNYDSFYWYTHFGDPEFQTHASMARVLGLIALRYADDQVLPFDMIEYANAIQSYVQEIVQFNESVDFSFLVDAANNFSAAALVLSKELENASSLSPLALRALNDRLMLTERAFIGDPAESSREWYLHVIFAPSEQNAYAGQPFPAIWNAMIEGDWEGARFIASRIGLLLMHAGDFMTGKLWKV